MRIARSAVVGVVVVAVGLAGGCSPGRDGTAPGNRRASPAVSATPGPSPRPTGVQVVQSDTALPPGSYRSGNFRPGVSFTLATQWHPGYDNSTHLDLFLRPYECRVSGSVSMPLDLTSY